jgi:hypothetical protein
MMTIMGKPFSKRGVSVIIAALLLIAIAVAAAVLLYVFSIGLMGSLGSSGGQQTKQQLIMEAYSWPTGEGPTLNLRNVGSAGINVGTADVFLGGYGPTTLGGGCTGTLAVQASCTTDPLAATDFAPSGGVSYVIKVVTADGAVFSYSAIYGQSS